MGYRLHYAQRYAPEWEGGYFNWDMDKWEDLFFARFNENGWKDENSDIFEVFRGDLEEYIKEIEGNPEDFNEFFPNDDSDKQQPNGYTNAQIIEVLREILTSDDDNIRLECF